MAQRKNFRVEYFIDHFPNEGIEVDFSDQIALSKANKQSCGCGNENCDCNCDDNSCDESCKCACHNSPEVAEANAIEYSNRIIKALESKISIFNKENSPRKVRLNRLKEVYCAAVENCNENKNLYALARVNKFLEVVADFNSLSAKDLKLALGELDLLGNWTPSEEDLASSEKDVQKYNLNFSFGSVDELFIETSNSRASYEIEY